MSEPSVHTTQLHGWLVRIRAGDAMAREEMLQNLCGRLEGLAHKMLRGFPNVRRWADTGDVLQNALLRLLRALQTIQPDSMKGFFCLAAEQIRRELLDLARYFQARRSQGISLPEHESDSSAEQPVPAADAADEGQHLERWAAFHDAVATLPAEQREVFSLAFYHGWTQLEIAELFQVDERTVRRRWQAACLQLQRSVGDLPLA